MKPLKMWCLKTKHGFSTESLAFTRDSCIRTYFSSQEWRKRYREGWRCVRVEIKEVEK